MSGGGVGYADCGCACHRKCHLDVKSKCTQAVAQGSAAPAAPGSDDTGSAFVALVDMSMHRSRNR